MVSFHFLRRLVAGCLCGLLFFLTACTDEKQPADPALKQLDLDGDFLLFMNTEAVEDRVCGQIDRTLEIASAVASDPVAEAEVRAGFEKVKAALKWSGLLSLDSYSTSSKPVDGGLNRCISLVEYSEEDSQKPAWKVCFSEPKVLKGIQYAPADAVYTVNGSISLSEAWSAAMAAVSSFCTPEQSQAIQQQVMAVEMMLGTNVAAIVESLDSDVMISLQLSETETVTLPVGTIAEPNLLIGIQTKSPLLGELLLSKFAEAELPVVQAKHGEVILHTLSLPAQLPIPVQPTLAVTDGYLLIGSTQDGVIRALDSKQNQDGLVATAMYKKLLPDVPEQVSSIAFMSPRCMDTYVDIMSQVIGSGSSAEEAALMEQMMGFYKNLYSGAYSVKTATSLCSKGYASYGGAQSVEMVASAYTGMIAAIGIPSILNAYSTSQDQAKARNVAEVEKAKGVLTLPVSSGLPGAMALTDPNLSLDSGEAHENLVKALRISDIGELDVGGDSIEVGSLGEKAHY